MSAERPTVDVGAWARRASRGTPVSVQSRALLLLLATYADRRSGECFPSQETLALDLGVSARKVRDYLRPLEEHGLVVKRRRGQGRTAVYVLPVENGTPGSGQDGKAEAAERNTGFRSATNHGVPGEPPLEPPLSSSVVPALEEEGWAAEAEAVIAAYRERTDTARGPGPWATYTGTDLAAVLAAVADPVAAVREWTAWAETAEHPQRNVVAGLARHVEHRQARTARTNAGGAAVEDRAAWAARQAAKLAEME